MDRSDRFRAAVPGEGATLASQTGATAAAKALGVDRLNEQFSAWAPEKMIEQFKQAMAAKPTCIVIMGHPGNDAFREAKVDRKVLPSLGRMIAEATVST